MDYNELNSKMENAMSYYEKELASIRTSRASTSMLDNILVDAYSSKTPISQLANINVPDSSNLTIQVWDNSLIKNIETAIIESNLGINPVICLSCCLLCTKEINAFNHLSCLNKLIIINVINTTPDKK